MSLEVATKTKCDCGNRGQAQHGQRASGDEARMGMGEGRSSLLGSLATRAEARVKGEGVNFYLSWTVGPTDMSGGVESKINKERNVPKEREEKERLATPLLQLSCTPLGEGTVVIS